MARLLEDQAKRIFMAAGIPVPPGDLARTPDAAAAIAARLGGAVVIKAQIKAGGRGKSGGILFAADPEAARAQAGLLLGQEIGGQLVDLVRVEARLDIQQELYLGVFSNPATRTPTLIFSPDGGVEIEAAAARGTARIGRLDIDMLEGLRPFMVLEMLRQAGVAGAIMQPLAKLAVALYQIYRQHDCLLAEINPVAVTARGLIAADARLAVDDDALFRQTELGIAGAESVGERAPSAFEQVAGRIDAHDHRGSAHFVQIDPDGSLAAASGKISIGFDGIGTGASLVTLDELVPLGFLPRNFCDTSGNPTASKLYRITRVILSQPGIEGYVFVSCLSSQQLDNTARGIVKAFKEIYRAQGGWPNIPCVLSFRGAWDETAIALFEEHGLTASPWLRVLGRDSTERDLAHAFKELHGRWRESRVSGVAA